MIKPWKLILLLAGIFIAGGVTGGLVMVRVGKEMFNRRPGPDQWAPNHMRRLVERLDLKPEQTEQIRPIVRRNMEELNRLRTTSMAEFKATFERMDKEISEILSPEQREKFDKLNKEMRERARKAMPDRQKGPGPGGAKGERERPPDEPGKPAGDKPPPEKPSGG